MEAKICSKCGEMKPLSEYYKNGKQGRRPDCRTCSMKVKRKWAVSDRGKEVLKRAMAKYLASEHGHNKRAEYYAKPEVKEAISRRIKEWSKSPEQKQKHAERARKYRSSGLGQYRSRLGAKVGRAVERGIIPRVTDLSCRHCGQQAQEYHHPSYEPEHWLMVVPLCIPCHKQVHFKAAHSQP